jgi:hypothetical protein
MKETGGMESSMGKVDKHKKIVILNIPETGWMALNMGKDTRFLKMELNIMDPGKLTHVMVMDITNGTMEDNIKVILHKINLMAKEFSSGLTVGATPENLYWTSKVGTDFISGQMEDHMKVLGWMVNNMERVNLLIKKEKQE